jgi:hypothetical protein
MVVDDDVAQRADRDIEMPAILHAEALGHRDLNRREVVAVPHRLEHRVREPQVQDLLEPHLAEEVIDSVELRLLDVLVQLRRQLSSGGEVVAEGLLDHHATTVADQPRLGEARHDHREQGRRDLQVEDRIVRSAEGVRDMLTDLIVPEIAAHVREPGRDAVEHVLLDLLAGL